jgi:hypothetical protein
VRIIDQPLTGEYGQERQSSSSVYQGDTSQSRPFTAGDAAELEAVTNTNKVFDKWLRNVMSA